MAIFLLRQRFIAVLIIFTQLCGLGCSLNFKDNSGAGDLDVQLPLASVPEDENENNTPTYQFQVVKLLRLFEIKKVRGQYAKFYLSPTIKDKRLSGTFPNAEFVRNKQNVYTPTNEISVQMATIYYHMQNMALLDEKLGVGSVNTWPRDIGIGVKIPQKTNTNSFQLMKNNALYEGSFDAILFVPEETDKLPIAVNGGILAHEHFHSLFFKMVMSKLYEEGIASKDIPMTIHSAEHMKESFPSLSSDSESDKSVEQINNKAALENPLSEAQLHLLYNSTLLKGLNEGLADFWGWIYTNDNNFIAHSLPSVAEFRTLNLSKADLEKLAFAEPNQISEQIKTFARQFPDQLPGHINEYAYVLGTQFARSLRAFVTLHKSSRKINLLKAKENIALAVIRFLPKVKDMFLTKDKQQLISANELALKMIEEIPELNMSECEAVIKVLNRPKGENSGFKCQNEAGKIKIQ